MGVVSLILGILAILSSPLGGGVLFGAIGIILGVLGKRDPEKAKISMAGLICSIIGLVISIILLVTCGGAILALIGMSSGY